jgi:D-xylonolactonase
MNTAHNAVADYANRTGEGCLWHPEERLLYWLDIPQGRLFRYDPASDRSELFDLGAPAGGFTLQDDGDLLLFMARGAIRTWREGRYTGCIAAELPEELGNRFNDVIADPEGRVFCGVMSTPARRGRLYRLDPDGRLQVVIEDVGTSNGMGFSPDLKRLYFTDTNAGTIFLYDYERATGEITNRRPFIVHPQPGGGPDGMTVDAEGRVWSARWNGGCLARYGLDGKETDRIAFPSRKVSCVTFAGDDCRDLYVTTAGGPNKADEGWGAGALFHLRPGVQGRPEFRSNIHTPIR